MSGGTGNFREKQKRVLQEKVVLVAYDPRWPGLFEAERDHLRECLPQGLLGRIEHYGSTAVPGLVAKPVVDLLVEVTDLKEVRERIPPILEPQGYDYFWRPTHGDDGPPWYAWFIKRDTEGRRTHHIHMVEADFIHWDGLLFRDYLVAHPDVAQQYGELKERLASEHAKDRIAYTQAKGDFIRRVTDQARRELHGQPPG